MTCDKFLVLLDELDNEVLPAEMVAHMRSCHACAGEIAVLAKALRLHRLPEAAGAVDMAPRVLALLPFTPAPRRSLSMREWAVPGILILASMVIVPMLAEFRDLKTVYGDVFTFPLAMALGSAVTLYAGIFILGHLDDFSRRFRDFRTTRA